MRLLLDMNLTHRWVQAHTLAAKPSVILLRGEPLVPELRGKSLLEALETCAAELEEGAILTLDWSGKPRARLLPLK